MNAMTMRSMPATVLLAVVVASISALALVLNLSGAAPIVPVYVAAGGLAFALAMFLTPGTGAFLRFFVIFYGLGYIGLITILLAGGIGGFAWVGLIPPLTAFTAAAFGMLAILLSRIGVTREVFQIADPYFETEDKGTTRIWPFGSITAREKWIAWVLLGIIILINLGQVGLVVRHNQFSRDIYDALQNKNEAEFWRQLFQIWVPLVATLLFSNLIEFVLVGVFKVRWREWMTTRLTSRWLDGGSHYRLQFNGGVDNPDQRIQEDIRKYTETTYSLTIAMISQISTLVSFSVILWGLSSTLPFPSEQFRVPGFLFWIALLYAAVGTLIAHIIGRRLIPLNFDQEKYEANFRYMLARLREFNEPVALLKGEGAEKKRLFERFRLVVRNYMDIIGVQKWLSAFTGLYGYSNSVIPLVITAPFFFAGKMTLGVMMQTAGAFARVDAALSFFIDRYATLADYKAVVDRLNGFDRSIEGAKALQKTSDITRVEFAGADIRIPELSLALPSGRAIAHISDISFRKGERTLLVGPSGSGKSTLFRAVAGIWPFGSGRIEQPEGGSVMLLPQRPYIPIGTLRGAVNYPAVEGTHPDEDIRHALEAVGLPMLVDRLDEEANWSQVLSGGEQQRLAIARALLAKPDWLFLDESTSALDEPLEDRVYRAIRETLPTTTIVSIGHRSSLIGNHDRRMEMRMGADNLFTVADAPVKA